MIVFSLLTQAFSPLHLKEALHNFSVADLNCQHNTFAVWSHYFKSTDG
jgi:hypothetical protein